MESRRNLFNTIAVIVIFALAALNVYEKDYWSAAGMGLIGGLGVYMGGKTYPELSRRGKYIYMVVGGLGIGLVLFSIYLDFVN